MCFERRGLCPESTCIFQCLIIGAGPCGLRTAIDLSLLGAKVVVIEKRDAFSRNNVLHLWPFTIHDLRGLGAKKFYGKFCAGAIDHISEYRQLLLFPCSVDRQVGYLRNSSSARMCPRPPVLLLSQDLTQPPVFYNLGFSASIGSLVQKQLDFGLKILS